MNSSGNMGRQPEFSVRLVGIDMPLLLSLLKRHTVVVESDGYGIIYNVY